MTNREITSEIVNILKSNNKDNRLSRRFILSLLRDSAEFLIAQKWGERSILTETSLYSYLPCFEFEKIDTNLVLLSLLAGVGAVAILFTGIFLIVKFDHQLLFQYC